MEGIKQPEVNIEELISLLDEIKWENGNSFKFNGTEFLMLISTIEELNEPREPGVSFGDEAEIFGSNTVDGFDIYLHDTINESQRKRVLFHEILEGNLRHKFNLEGEQAHQIAFKEEEKVFGPRKK